MNNILQDFNKHIRKINNINQLITFSNCGNREYFFLVKVTKDGGESKDQWIANFIMTDGIRFFWLEQFDFEKFQKVREEVKIEGTYLSFFELLSDALRQRSLDIQEMSSNNFLNLIVYFHINKKAGITLKGIFKLGIPMTRDANEKQFALLIKEFIKDLLEAKNQEKQDLDQSNKNLSQENQQLKEKIQQGQLFAPSEVVLQEIAQQVDATQKKRKPKTDLIIPNIPKKPRQGAKMN